MERAASGKRLMSKTLDQNSYYLIRLIVRGISIQYKVICTEHCVEASVHKIYIKKVHLSRLVMHYYKTFNVVGSNVYTVLYTLQVGKNQV